MRKHGVVAAVSLAVLLSGCSDYSPTPVDAGVVTGPNDEELRQDIYDAAVDACETIPPRRNEDPVTAAEDYAAGYQDQFEQAAFDGCLEGFRRAGALP